MLSALDHLARQSPVVLVIEDAHWADRSSRDLLTFLIGNQRAIGGLLIIVTFRSDELHRTHPLRPLLAALDRIAWVERVELPRLTRHDTAELAAGILGRQLAATWPTRCTGAARATRCSSRRCSAVTAS